MVVYKNVSYDDRDTGHLIYTSNWFLTGTWNASNVGETGTLSSANNLTANVTFTFPEQAVAFYYYGIPRCCGGYYAICVDCDPNNPIFTHIDAVNTSDDGRNPPVVLYSITFDEPGVHEIILTNQNDTRFGKSQITIDRFDLQVVDDNATPVTVVELPSSSFATQASTQTTQPALAATTSTQTAQPALAATTSTQTAQPALAAATSTQTVQPAPAATTTTQTAQPAPAAMATTPIGAIVGGVGGVVGGLLLLLLLFLVMRGKWRKAHRQWEESRPHPARFSYAPRVPSLTTSSEISRKKLTQSASLPAGPHNHLSTSTALASTLEHRREIDAGRILSNHDDLQPDTLPPEYEQVFGGESSSRAA